MSLVSILNVISTRVQTSSWLGKAPIFGRVGVVSVSDYSRQSLLCDGEARSRFGFPTISGQEWLEAVEMEATFLMKRGSPALMTYLVKSSMEPSPACLEQIT